ncbi:MAG: hypothetical protein K0Q73_5301 [Paenibacillus sp.]|jgi:hypothetical protein|nr:hypothetical protein [Paenibacillus sp.]MDF2787924.1 hypothetical protein [Neobacillus sp.]
MALMACVFHGNEGVDYNVKTTDGKTFRLRGGQVIFDKGYDDEWPYQTDNLWPDGAGGWSHRFSARDLHNDISGDDYPDFWLPLSGTNEWKEPNSGKKVYLLNDFNQRLYGSNWAADGGSRYTVTETVAVMSHDNPNEQIWELEAGDKVRIGAGYGHVLDGGHSLISCSGWDSVRYGRTNRAGYFDFDPSEYPSKSGINTF